MHFYQPTCPPCPVPPLQARYVGTCDTRCLVADEGKVLEQDACSHAAPCLVHCPVLQGVRHCTQPRGRASCSSWNLTRLSVACHMLLGKKG
jgi:hypothetical protein